MSSHLQQRPGYARITEASDLSLEIVILLVLGVFMVLFGLLLFKIHTGELPYNPDGTYGLFLVIVSFQTITMGKTPFGDLRRSRALILTGISTAVLGMTACFIPGTLTGLVRMLVGTVLLAGGTVLLAQLFFSEKKARTWMRIAGILRQLTVACGFVYAMTVVMGVITLSPGFTTDRQTAVLLIGYGAGFFYLSWCIRKAAKAYPSEQPPDGASSAPNPDNAGSARRFGLFRDASLPLMPAILILLGILLALLGLLLFPVNTGLLPFSPDGQLGVLLTLTAIQMMALGDTPLGRYTRSSLMILTGLVFAALGIVSCIVPGMLTGMIQTFLGLLNIIGGASSLIRRYAPMPHKSRVSASAPSPVPPTVRKLMLTQTVLNLVTVVFGVSMLVPSLVSGLVVAGILVVNGLLLFALASLLQELTRMQPSG